MNVLSTELLAEQVNYVDQCDSYAVISVRFRISFEVRDPRFRLSR
ncbi:hypothetical protein Tco_0611869, partial [Tanacetum coccineum]